MQHSNNNNNSDSRERRSLDNTLNSEDLLSERSDTEADSLK